MAVNDSIRKRYFYKLIVRMISLFLYAAKVSLVPRALGPARYGDFTFLSSVFTSILNFFDFGTSNAFFNYGSKNKDSGAAVIFYVLYSLALPIILIAAIVIISFSGLTDTVFPEQTTTYIYLAALLGWLTWLSGIVFGYSDAKGLTVVSEIVRVKVRVIFTLLLGALFLFQYLNLFTFFIFCILETIGFIIYTILCCTKEFGLSEFCWRDFRDKAKALVNYFYKYCSPLFLYSLIVLLASLWGRWFLQVVGGSTEQGFFGLSDKIGSISLIFTVSMIPIFMNEFSKAHGLANFDMMRKLFRENAKFFYFIAGFLAVFFAIHTPEITQIFAGSEFSGAILPIAIMAFYPLHQTYGQMNGAVYYSTERTKAYRNIGIACIFVGITANYFCVAPKDFFLPGLGLGATGAVISGVLVQIFGTNVQLRSNCRYLKLKYSEFFWHQLTSIGLLFLALFGVKMLIKFIANLLHVNIGIWIILPSGVLYVFAATLVVFCLPRATIGFERERMMSFIKAFVEKIKSIYHRPPAVPGGEPTGGFNL